MNALAFAQVVDCLSLYHVQLLNARDAQAPEELMLDLAGRIQMFSLVAQQMLVSDSDGKAASN